MPKFSERSHYRRWRVAAVDLLHQHLCVRDSLEQQLAPSSLHSHPCRALGRCWSTNFLLGIRELRHDRQKRRTRASSRVRVVTMIWDLRRRCVVWRLRWAAIVRTALARSGRGSRRRRMRGLCRILGVPGEDQSRIPRISDARTGELYPWDAPDGAFMPGSGQLSVTGHCRETACTLVMFPSIYVSRLLPRISW